jgi:hypothetical protein
MPRCAAQRYPTPVGVSRGVTGGAQGKVCVRGPGLGLTGKGCKPGTQHRDTQLLWLGGGGGGVGGWGGDEKACKGGGRGGQ